MANDSEARLSAQSRTSRTVMSMVAVCLMTPAVAHAVDEAPSGKLLVLRSDDIQRAEALSQEVDRVLLRALSRAGFSDTYLSPTPYADIELLANCTGHASACLERVAHTLDTDWLLVRELVRDAAGTMVLSLTTRKARSNATRRALAPIALHGRQNPGRVVPTLVSDLYPQAPTVYPAAVSTTEQKDSASEAARPLRKLGWAGIALGGALLSAGAVASVLASRDRQAYGRIPVVERPTSDEASALRERADQRTDIARGLFIASAAAFASGLGFWLWDSLRGEPKRARSLGAAALATRHGAAVTLQGGWPGF